jgi:hypothetical protein
VDGPVRGRHPPANVVQVFQGARNSARNPGVACWSV